VVGLDAVTLAITASASSSSFGAIIRSTFVPGFALVDRLVPHNREQPRLEAGLARKLSSRRYASRNASCAASSASACDPALPWPPDTPLPVSIDQLAKGGRIPLRARMTRSDVAHTVNRHGARLRGWVRCQVGLVPDGFDDGFHVDEYLSSARRPAAVSRYSVRGMRPSNDFSHAMYSAPRAPRVHAQIAVRRLQHPFEIVERQSFVHRQRADDAEPQPLVNQPIELQWAFLG